MRISGFFISLSDILNQKSETSYQVDFYASGVQTRTEMLENAIFTFTPATKKISDTVYEVKLVRNQTRTSYLSARTVIRQQMEW